MPIYLHHISRNQATLFGCGGEITVKFSALKSKSTLYCIFIDTAYYYFRVTLSDVTI